MTTEKLSLQNQKVFDLLSRSKTPLSAYEILDKLRKHGVRSPPTVYRALEKLQQMGLVHRVETLNAFVVCRHVCGKPHGGVSPFAICTSCGAVQELCEPTLARALKKLGAEFLAEVGHKIFEVSGICHACQSKKITHV
ncbi:MAG: Fur family transcriptional regulator [Alphaproteobacteria bacterium]|nr:Fur family transcriptional regulator [Alphaproteobacteria bacterium]